MSSALTKIRYAAGTLVAVAKDAVCGTGILVGKEEKERRLGICKGCEHYKELCGQPRCNECGCFAALKTELKSATCPCGKW